MTIVCVHCGKPVPQRDRRCGPRERVHFDCALRERQRRARERYAAKKGPRA